MEKHRHCIYLFTLIELLVVVAVTVLLLAILMPALNRSRAMAKQINCISNQRQVGIAIMMYAGDYNGWFRAPYDPNLDVAPWSEPYIWNLALITYGYVTTGDIFHCPGFNNKYNLIGTQYLYLRSYGIRAQYLSKYIDIKNIQSPSGYWLCADSFCTASAYTPCEFYIIDNYSEHTVHFRHNRKANVLYADGSARATVPSYFDDYSWLFKSY